MLSLAFECAGRGLSAALAEDGQLIGTTQLDMDRGQPAALLPALHALLTAHRRNPSALERIGCTLGPGGFTGIRLGIAAGLGLARATGAVFHGFNAFDVYTLGDVDRRGLCIALESRRAELFIRAYDTDGVSVLLNDEVLTPEDTQRRINVSWVLGSAAEKLNPTATNAEPDMAVLASFLSKASKNDALLTQSQNQATPLYLRAPEIGGGAKP